MLNSVELFDAQDRTAAPWAALGTVRSVAGTLVTVEVAQAGGATALVAAPAIHLVAYAPGDRVLVLFQGAHPASAVVAGRIDSLTDLVDPAQFLRADGSTPLTADWDAGATAAICTQEIRARDGSGLQIADENGILGIFVDDGGNVGMGTTQPQGQLHLWDGAGGEATLSRTNLGATAQTLIAAGVGSVSVLVRVEAILYNGSARAYLGFTLTHTGTLTQNITTGADTWQFRLNANGSLDLRRTAGTGTGTACVRALWM